MFKFEIGQVVYFLEDNKIAHSQIKAQIIYNTNSLKSISYKLEYPYEKYDYDENKLFNSKKEILLKLAEYNNIKITID